MLRLCVIRIEGMCSINKEALRGVTNIKPRLEGTFRRPANYFLDSFWFEGLNYTVKEVESLQVCVTSISQNESDYMPVLYEFPVNKDYDKVNPFIIIAERKIAMVQAYNQTDQSNVKTSISRLNWQVWLTLAFLLTHFAVLLKFRQHFLKKSFLSSHRIR